MTIKKIALFLVLMIFPVCFIVFSGEISQQIKDGIGTCLNIIVPSLFCFMALSSFLLKTGYADILILPFERLIKALFGVDKFGASAVFLSLVGGYPVGAALITEGLRDNIITKEQADRLLCFCVNAGPAFLIGAVGLPILGDIKLGLIIYLSHILTSLTIANLTRKNTKNTGGATVSKNCMKARDAVIFSAKSAAGSLFTVCSLIILFSAIYAILSASGIVAAVIGLFDKFISAKLAEAVINGTLEICKGCSKLAALRPIEKILAASGLTAFGGICVHMQIAAITNPYKLNIKKYVVYKGVGAALSVLYTFLLLKVFNIPIQAASYSVSSLGNSAYNHISSVFLIGLCVLLLLNFEKSDIIKLGNKSCKEQLRRHVFRKPKFDTMNKN